MSDEAVRTIQPTSGWRLLDVPELVAYRELLWFLAWRDVKVRYRQTILGMGWAVLQPFLLMVVFTVFFGNLAGVPSDGAPYPVFALAALVPWTLFANGVTSASNSLVGNVHLVTKVYFPRVLVPAAGVGATIIDFAVASVVLGGLMAYYGIRPSLAVLWLPGFVALAVVATLGVGLWLAALNVQFRDVRHAVPFLVQILLFASPIAYPSGLVPDAWRAAYALNPMVGVVDGFRWALLGEVSAPGGWLAISVGSAVALLLSGLAYFRRMERTFADIV